MTDDKKQPAAKKSSPPESSTTRRSWLRWIVPALGLVVLVLLGLEIRERLRSDVWAYFTDEEGLKVEVQEKKERMVLWQDPEQSLFEEKKPAPGEAGSIDSVNQASKSVEASFSPDGTMMVLTRRSMDFEKDSPEETGADLYLSRWDGRTWSRPEEMSELNTSGDEGGAAFSRDGQYLYFTSNREGGAGGYDIYVARNKGQTWTAIERLGDTVNSAMDEKGPAPSADGSKLYFSTNRNDDSKELDIYVAGRNLPKAPAAAEAIDAVLIGAASDGWKFTAAAGVEGETWRNPDYDDSEWKAGKAPLGYGEPAIAQKNGTTIELQGQAVLFRRKFTVSQAAIDSNSQLTLQIASDDYGIVWLNGQQVDQENKDHEPVEWNRTVPVAANILRKGENIIAVRVENKTASSDLYLDLQLKTGSPAAKPAPEAVAKPTEPELPAVPVFTQAEAITILNSDADDIETALTGRGDYVFLASARDSEEQTAFNLYLSRVVSGEAQVPEKIDLYIKEGQATDPAERKEGFDLLFSSNADLAPGITPAQPGAELIEPVESGLDYRLYRSTTREVIGFSDDKRWNAFKDWLSANIWWLLAMIAALVILIYLLEKWRDLTSLYHKCLAASAIAHLLLLLLMMAWLISQSMAGGDQQSPEVTISMDALDQEELAMESEQELAEVAQSTQLIVAKNVQEFKEVAFNPTVVVSNPVPVARKTSDQSLVSDFKPSKANEAEPSDTAPLTQPEAPALKELTAIELPELLVEELEVGAAPTAKQVEAVDLTQDDFKRNEEAIQQVKTNQEQIDKAKSKKVEVISDADSVARSTFEDPETEETIDPVDGLEADDAPKKNEGTRTQLAENLPGSDPVDALTSGLELEVGAVDPTKGDFKGSQGAIQQVKTGKANTGAAGNQKVNVESGAKSVAAAGKPAPTTDTGGSTVNPVDGLVADSTIPELEGASTKAALALNLPGTDPLDSLVADIKLETPKNSLDEKTLSKYVKKLAGRPSLEVIKQLGGSDATEGAIRMALDWFSDTQEPDGRWEMGKHGSRKEYNTAGAGLAMLCYYGWGIKRGANTKHSKALAKAVDWLLKQQGPDGNLRGPGGGNHGTYAHGIAAIALCEAYGLTKDPKLKEPATKAIQYIINSQDKKGGGWRYQPGQAGDLSATGWHYMALHSGRMAGIEVPDEVFARGREFISSVSGGTHNGIYGYTNPSSNHPAMTATGMFLRQLDLTPPTDPRQQESAGFLKTRMLKPNKVDFYFDYYATLSLYQHQGPIWTEWNENLKKIYVSQQHKVGANRGSWDPKGNHTNAGGRVLATGLAVLSLEVYYRLLPMYGFGRN